MSQPPDSKPARGTRKASHCLAGSFQGVIKIQCGIAARSATAQLAMVLGRLKSNIHPDHGEIQYTRPHCNIRG